MSELLIREMSHEDCGQIAGLFCTDDILRGELGFVDGAKPTINNVAEKYREWCQSKSATS